MNANNMKRTLIFIPLVLIYLCCSGVFAQQKINVDSLSNLLEQNQIHDTIKLELLNKLADFHRNTDYKQSLQYSNQLLHLSQHLNDKAKEIEAYFLLSLVKTKTNEDQNTITPIIEKGLAISQELKDTIRTSRLYGVLARVYMRDGFHDKAYAIYQKSLELSELQRDTIQTVIILNNMSLILKKEKKLDRAKSYYRRAISIAEYIPNRKKYLAALFNNLGSIYDNQDSTVLAKYYYKQSLALKKELKNYYSMVPTLHNIAVINKMDKKFELANQQLKEGYQIACELEAIDGLGLILVAWADLALEQKDFYKALERLKEGKAALENNGDLYQQMKCYEYLSYTYDSLGDYRQSLKNYEIYKTLQDSIFKAESFNTISELETKYQVQQKETENKLLKAEQEVALKQSRNTRSIAYGLLLALLSTLGWGYMVYKANRQKKLMNEILEARVQERTRDLNTANQELQQANYELRTLNYIASHDIKEPIRNISSFVDLIQRKIPDETGKQLEFYFSTIKHSTTQLYNIIEDFSIYTTLSKETLSDISEVDMNEIAQQLMDHFQEDGSTKKGKIINHGLPPSRLAPLFFSSPSSI